MFRSLAVINLLNEIILVTLSILVIVLYPILFAFLLILTIYRHAIQKILKATDPKIVEILSGMDASLAAHNTYATKAMLCPVYCVTTKVDLNQMVKVFNENIFKPKGNDGKCLFPELRQKIVRKWGYNWWYSVDDFKVEDHIRYLNENNPDQILSREGLAERLRDELLKLPFNPERSPWDMIIVNNYVDESNPKTKAAIIFRCHHCFLDGYSIVKVMKAVATNPWKELGGKMTTPNKNKAFLQNILQFSLVLLTAPYHALKMTHFTTDRNEWARKALDEYSDTLMVQEVKPIPMSLLKDVKNNHKVSFSSVPIALTIEAILAGMRRDNVDTNVDKIHIALPFPLPNHPEGRLTNHWSAVKMPVRVCKNDPSKTLQNIEEEFRKLRKSTAPLVGHYVSKILGLLPIPMIPDTDGLIKCTCLLSNFPGPLHEIDMFGYRVSEHGTAAITPKGYAFLVACISYNGTLRVTTSGDKCNFREQEDIDFIANAYENILDAFRGDREQNIIITNK